MIQTITSAVKNQKDQYSFRTQTDVQFVTTLLLVLGNVAFVLAIFTARSAPSSGYEVDIYRATPALFWIGVGVAMISALWVLSRARRDVPWFAALTLLGISGLSIPALPLIRGYFFYGLSDPLNHLGWARELVAGQTTFFGDIYPASHVTAAFISVLGGAPIERGMLLVVFLLIVCYVVFSVLTVRVLLPGRTATTIALVSALLFLPINHVSFGPQFHTYSLATFFFPFVLYLVVKHVTGTPDSTLPGRLSATDLAFAFAGAAIVVFHPQVAANVVVLLGTMAVVQLVARRRYPESRFGRSKPVYGQFVFMTAVFFAWNVQYTALFDLSSNLGQSLLDVVMGTSAADDQLIADRAASADGVGTSIVALFGKIFLVKVLYFAVAAAVVGRHVVRYLKRRSSPSTHGHTVSSVDITVGLFAISGVSLAAFFVAHYVGNIQGYFFRHVGFGMVLVMVVAAVGLTQFFSSAQRAAESRRIAPSSVFFVLATVALVVSMAAFFPSPYVAKPTSHVSEQQYVGYATTFEYAAESAAYGGLRTGPQRYYDARGDNIDNRLSWPIYPEDMGPALRDVRANDFPKEDFYYLFLTETDRQKELVAYNGLRYTAEDFDSVTYQEGVSRVFTNGEVDTYQVLYSTVEDDGPGE